MKSKKLHIYSIWIIQIIIGLLFIAAGAGKFLAADIWSEKFSNWGYPDNFYLFIGVVELLAAILLFIPKLSKNSARLLVVVMLGAILTHIFNQEAIQIIRPIIFMAMLIVLILLKKKNTNPESSG